MANAQWHAVFIVTHKDGQFQESLYFSSPDLVNTKLATRRAAKVAKERVKKRITKMGFKSFKLSFRSFQCVG